jgi:hypothetical protein
MWLTGEMPGDRCGRVPRARVRVESLCAYRCRGQVLRSLLSAMAHKSGTGLPSSVRVVPCDITSWLLLRSPRAVLALPAAGFLFEKVK